MILLRCWPLQKTIHVLESCYKILWYLSTANTRYLTSVNDKSPRLLNILLLFPILGNWWYFLYSIVYNRSVDALNKGNMFTSIREYLAHINKRLKAVLFYGRGYMLKSTLASWVFCYHDISELQKPTFQIRLNLLEGLLGAKR